MTMTKGKTTFRFTSMTLRAARSHRSPTTRRTIPQKMPPALVNISVLDLRNSCTMDGVNSVAPYTYHREVR